MPRVWTFPAAWEELLWDAARAELPAGVLELRSLEPAILARTQRYTDARDALGERLTGRDAQRDLAARALFFTVADAPKIAVPLAELAGRGLMPERTPLHVLDVGAGAGAMSLGALHALGRDLRVTAVDRDAGALAIFRRVAAAIPSPRLELTALAADVDAAPAGAFDLVLAGTVLNELPAPRRLPLARALLQRITPAGAVILVEPALRETARALHELRDALLAAGDAHVFAPCTRRGPCPALDDPRDWCHEDRRTTPAPRLAELSRRTGLRAGGLKFSYLTLRRDPTPLVAAAPPARALRVVSGALDHKGTIERIVCGDDGRTRLRVLRRERTDSARAVADSERGDVLLVDGDGATTRSCPASSRR
jgi:ribosomal protein RSM22 (predicted rRNA methylase)